MRRGAKGPLGRTGIYCETRQATGDLIVSQPAGILSHPVA